MPLNHSLLGLNSGARHLPLLVRFSAQWRVFCAGLAELGCGLVRLTGAVAALYAAINAFLSLVVPVATVRAGAVR